MTRYESSDVESHVPFQYGQTPVTELDFAALIIGSMRCIDAVEIRTPEAGTIELWLEFAKSVPGEAEYTAFIQAAEYCEFITGRVAEMVRHYARADLHTVWAWRRHV